ncbi:sulfur carrier protein ThiS [Sphingobacterium sp. lm-10]|uniref:sulfur carrier protein ThiS n=1 Tax=Sphingobacterium sp. lm-10 TaxID=2944904 RepID=UPI0020203C76|nr:sulfur carrier protein ThiS [Sphingobacterium sp. lm-10]MCL7987457.1 sulfur carrier protein ThiS [Sphingobacterium sp. lm-10]
MTLHINQQARFFEESPQHLAALVALEMQGKTRGIAVAINQQVIPKDRWAHTPLQEQDQILIISATQGG